MAKERDGRWNGEAVAMLEEERADTGEGAAAEKEEAAAANGADALMDRLAIIMPPRSEGQADSIVTDDDRNAAGMWTRDGIALNTNSVSDF